MSVVAFVLTWRSPNVRQAIGKILNEGDRGSGTDDATSLTYKGITIEDARKIGLALDF